jgi:hypothetical protein
MVVVAIDAVETALSLLLSSSLGLGATTEETTTWDGGGRGKKRRQHDNKLEAVAAELAWRPAVAAAASSLLVLPVGIILLWCWDCLNFGEKRLILCVTEKKTPKKQSPYWNGDSPNRFG